MSDALLVADERARARAVDPGRSILLQAPAGSGKTAVLTQRFLRLLCTVDQPGEILAITFTRRAAAEMRGRVRRALSGEIAADDPCADELRSLAAAVHRHAAARGWELARDVAQLRIQTIDSFNFWLATQLPLASRAGGALTVTETPQELYQRAARATLTAADGEPTLGAGIELLFERLDNHWMRVERLLAQMLEQRGHWLRYVLSHEPQALGERVNASLATVVTERLTLAQQRLGPALRRALEALPTVGALGSAPAGLAAWQRLVAVALTKDRKAWRRSLTERHLGPGFASAAARTALADAIARLEAVPAAYETLCELARLPASSLSAADLAALAALSRVLRRAAVQLQAEFASSGIVDYTYLSGAAREALGTRDDPTDLALRTGLALRHVLVDEFQDTSLAQAQLLETLTAGWEEGDGRTLFVVGDPMQSIYRFRDAEVGLFLAARESGVGSLRLEPLRLTRNFRAAAALVEWTNEVFAQAFPAADDLRAGAVAYSESRSASRRRPVVPDVGALLRLFPNDSAAEAGALAARVAALRRADARGSIAVLVAAHAHAAPVVRELTALGVASIGVDLVPLAERPVVRDLVQLARALHDLADRRAWLAVLRAPWCGARLRTLTALSSPEDPQLLWEALADAARLADVPPAERERIARVHAVLRRSLERRERASSADELEACWLALGAPDAYPAEDLEDARAFFSALAARAATGEWRGPEDFPALLQNLFSAPLVADANPVQIMTIHRAKGLEFDHVLVPALERSSGSGEQALLRWIDLPRAGGGSELLMAPTPSIGDEDTGDVGSLIGRLLAQRAAHERTRLMYVAATRARHTLYLSAAPVPRADGMIKPDPRSLLACLWPSLEARAERVSPAAVAAARGAGVPLRRLKDGWQPPVMPPAAELSHLPPAHTQLEPPEFSWVGETQRHVGTVVHSRLARFAQAAQLPAAAALAAERARILEELRQHGVGAGERPQAAERVLAALTRTLADERGRWILDAAHRAAASELALTGIAGGRLRSVVIDRSFVDEAGTRWVIDYKTSSHEGGGLEEFLSQELERYRPQLSAYMTLARALGPEPVRGALYFPLLGAFRELL
jgi:ATP-dependent exoDNAse (exonuclease V) beta subunit